MYTNEWPSEWKGEHEPCSMNAIPAILMLSCESSSRFSALRSRCTTPRLWQYATAANIWRNRFLASRSFIRPWATRWSEAQTDTCHVALVTRTALVGVQTSGMCSTKLMKKALRETQTLRAKNFRPAADPLSGGAGRPKFNQIYLRTQFGEDQCMQFRVIVVTDPQTHKPTRTKNPQTGPITIHCDAASA